MLSPKLILKHNIEYLRPALALYEYLVRSHWNGKSLSGPDPGIRMNTRVGRFVKSYLGFLPWSDNLVYLQTQGYWIFSNWQIFDFTGDDVAQQIALACSDNVVEMQKPEGYWEYPNPEWKDRVATVEGCFAALGLLESYARSSDEKYLQAALQWFDYLGTDIGFRQQEQGNMWAINYFAHRSRDAGGVPNNSTLLLWFLARLYEVTNDPSYLESCEKMVAWLKHVQLPSGELPYALGRTPDKDKTHFLCFQYNAFEFMDLVHYYKITKHESIWPVIESLSRFLSSGLTIDGQARFDCNHENPDVPYYGIAIARALSQATDLELGDYRAIAKTGFAHALTCQREDGGLRYHSQRNYGFLADRRSYPRYLSMILHHLLLECDNGQVAAADMATSLGLVNES